MARKKKIEDLTAAEIDAMPIDELADVLARSAWKKALDSGQLDNLIKLLDEIEEEEKKR